MYSGGNRKERRGGFWVLGSGFWYQRFDNGVSGKDQVEWKSKVSDAAHE